MTDRSSEPQPLRTSARSPRPAEHPPSRWTDSGPWRALLSIGEDLHLSENLEAGLERVAGRLAAVVPYDTLGVLLLDGRARELRFAFAAGYSPEVAEHWRFGLGQGIVGTVARTGESMLVEDVRGEPRYIDAGADVTSELAVPLTTRGRTIGVLVVGSREKGGLTPLHREILETFAGQLASAVEAARLYQATRDQAKMLSLLHEANRELTSILDQECLLDRVAELVERLIRYDVFTVYLWNPERLLLEPALARFRDGLAVGRVGSMALGEGLCGTAATLRRSIRVPDVAVDPRYRPCGHGLPIRSELSVPLVFEDRLVGVIDLESTEPDAFRARDEELLSTLGASMAIALENARLYEQVRESERALEEDLGTAREIQKRLLPRATALVPGLQVGVAYEPARHLGGDFYDILPLGDGRAAVAVGDVSGKGSSAALYGALAIGMLRENALYNNCCGAPSRMLRELNEKLYQLGFGNRFLALTFAIYDAEAGRVTLAGSGLPHPYRVGPAGGVEELEVEGVPLGLLPGREYEDVEIELPPGASLVIPTDGIEEALRAGEEFGRERIRTVLSRLTASSASAKDVADGLLDDARRFAGPDDPAADDRTVLVLKRP